MINRHFLAAAALVTALCGAGAAAGAQSDTAATPAPAASAAPFPHRHRPSRMARALRTLNLTSDQQTQIRSILRDARSAKQSGTPETHRQVVSQIEGLLTPAQRATFEAALRHRPAAQPQPAATP